MKIKLEPPFNYLWNKGYLRQDKSGRRRVDLFNTDQDRTTISYARYLMCVKEGRLLSDDEEVDHKDNDSSNDSLENLQILSVKEHTDKTARERSGRTFINLSCFYCGVIFSRELRQIKNSRPFCSRSCNGKHSRSIQLKKETNEHI